MKKFILILLILIICFLTGCYDYGNINSKSFVTSIGLDYDGKEYTVYYHITETNTLSTINNSTDSTSPYYVAKSKGETIIEGINNLNNYSNQTVELTHVRSFVISESFYTYENCIILISLVKTFPKINMNCNVYVTGDKLEDVFKTTITEDTSPYFSILFTPDINGYYEIVNFQLFSKKVLFEHVSIELPYIKTSDKIYEGKESSIYSTEFFGKAYLNKNKELIIINHDDFIGILFSYEINNLLLQHQSLGFLVEIYRIHINFDKKDSFNIHIFMSISTALNPENLTDQEIIKLCTSFIKKEIEKVRLYGNQNDIDFFSLNKHLYCYNKLKNGLDYKTVNVRYTIHTILAE